MSGQFPLRVSPSGPFEELGEPSLLASLAQFSKFGTGTTEEINLTVKEELYEAVSVSGPIPNTGAPSSGQLFEIDATLAFYFNDTAGVTNNNVIEAYCVLELDDGSEQLVPLPGPPSRDVGSNFAANHPYDWAPRARATVPANRTVVGAAVKLMRLVDLEGNPNIMGGSPSPHTLKITRVR